MEGGIFWDDPGSLHFQVSSVRTEFVENLAETEGGRAHMGEYKKPVFPFMDSQYLFVNSELV